MTIVHIDFTGTYNEEMNYQENLLPRANVASGHTVYFITTCYRWDNGVEAKTDSGNFLLEDGVHLIRIPYSKFGGEAIEKKIRAVNHLEILLAQLAPDIIFLHCIQTLAVYPILRYMRSNKTVVLYADTHTDFNNSARTFFSRWILHGIFYRNISHSIAPHVRKLFYVASESRTFVEKVYGFPIEKLEYMPLGGFLPNDKKYSEARNRIRKQYEIDDKTIVFTHSGKMDAQKKTKELVSCFHQYCRQNEKLLIVGSMDDMVREYVMPIIESDSNIIYLGWKSGSELESILCASDVYMQPGGQSATMQTAACCRCALALYPYKSHLSLWNNSVFYIENTNDIKKLLCSINLEELIGTRRAILKIAHEKLDYLELVKKIKI